MDYRKPPNNMLIEGSLQELINDAVERYEYFFFTENSGQKKRDTLKWLVNEFLNCGDDREREFFASVIISNALRPHAKGSEVIAAGSVLNVAELFGIHQIESNRKHFVHQVYTFLVGLLLYTHISKLRNQLNSEMKNTTNTLSSGTTWGEFLFRWRLCSLSHDIGNAISLFWDDEEQIDRYLRFFEAACNASWFPPPHRENASLQMLEKLSSGKTIFEEFRRVSGNDRLYKFYKNLKSDPYEGIRYDHGIVGGIVMARVIDDLYERHNREENTIINLDGNRVSFNRVFFDESIVRIVHAMAEHNIDFYPDKYRKPWKGEKLFDVKSNALSFLLKIADLLQEWNKPKANDENNFISPDKVRLRINNTKVVIIEHPKKNELREKLDKIIEGNGIVQIQK